MSDTDRQDRLNRINQTHRDNVARYDKSKSDLEVELGQELGFFATILGAFSKLFTAVSGWSHGGFMCRH